MTVLFGLVAAAVGGLPAEVYPAAPARAFLASERTFEETDESRRLGFDLPFPDGPRGLLRVDDFGAVADGVTDCTPAIYRALAAARRADGPAEIRFGAGRYRCLPHPADGSDDLAVLNVVGARDLLLRGAGPATVLLIGDPALGGLRVVAGDTVMVRDLTIDYDPLPFTQGTVDTVADGRFTLRVDRGYPTPGRLAELVPAWAAGGAHGGYRLAWAGDRCWLPINGLPVWPAATDGRPPMLTADAGPLAAYLTAGDRFVYVARRLAQMALGAAFTRAFFVHDVTVHASPTCGLGLESVDGARIEGYVDAAPVASNRLLATNADGIFCHGVRGGLTIRGCYFQGQGDDCINLHAPALDGRVVTPETDTALTVAAAIDIRAGDRLEVMDPAAGLRRGELTVRAADRIDGGLRLEVVPGLAAVGYNGATDRLYPLELACPRFKIVGNRFGQNRSRCLLIQARDGLIAGNTFENAEGYGVSLGYGGTAWPEGVIPADVAILGNLFRNLTNQGLAAAIEADGTPNRYLRGLTIEGNRFEQPRKMAILLNGVDGATIRDNDVLSGAGRRNTWNHPEWYPVDCSVFVNGCRGVVIDQLRVTDPGLTEAVVHITAATAPGDGGVRITNLRGEVPAGVPLVGDARRP